MALRSEIDSRNGTLSINKQTNIQRVKYGDRFGGRKGVGSNNLTRTLFPDSPIGIDETDLGNLNRSGGSAGLYDDVANVSNVYSAFANVIDGAVIQGGFGFKTTDSIDLNYGHDDAPTIADLTNGAVIADHRAFNGHPDLNVPENALNAPGTNQDGIPASSIEVASQPTSPYSSWREDGELPAASYGTSANEDRAALVTGYGDSRLGTHKVDGNDTLGDYFKENYVD
jgi:hypothetical protein